MTMTLIAVGLAGLVFVPGADMIRTICRTAEDPQSAAVECPGADEGWGDELAAMTTVEIPPTPPAGRHRRADGLAPVPEHLATYRAWAGSTPTELITAIDAEVTTR